MKKDNDYLFESSEPIKNPVAPTGTPAAGEVSKETFAKWGICRGWNLNEQTPKIRTVERIGYYENDKWH